MSFLASIEQAGYQHAGMEGYPWERARVERSLLAIDAIPGDLFFVPLFSFYFFLDTVERLVWILMDTSLVVSFAGVQ